MPLARNEIDGRQVNRTFQCHSDFDQLMCDRIGQHIRWVIAALGRAA
jgi:hypothetical protein